MFVCVSVNMCVYCMKLCFLVLVEDEDSVTGASMLTIIALLYFGCFIAFMCHHASAFVCSYSSINKMYTHYILNTHYILTLLNSLYLMIQ